MRKASKIHHRKSRNTLDRMGLCSILVLALFLVACGMPYTVQDKVVASTDVNVVPMDEEVTLRRVTLPTTCTNKDEQLYHQRGVVSGA